MKYIWRKHAERHWVNEHRDNLECRFGSTLAIIEHRGKVRLTFEVACRTERAANRLVHEFGGRIERLQRLWLRSFTNIKNDPLRVGSRLVVTRDRRRISPHQSQKRRRIIVIPAEAAFGTGEHATTAMCLRLLEHVTRELEPGWKMLDAGTGSGILAISGSCFGAGRVVALDNDPLACSTAKRNGRDNRIRNIQFSVADVLEHKLTEKFQIIAANLFSEILIEAIPLWSRHLSPEGCFILSGILRDQEAGIVRTLTRNRCVALDTRRRGKWVAILAKQQRSSP